MINYENKKFYFAGKSDKIDKDELIRFINQKNASIVKDIDEAQIIIEGRLVSLIEEELIYEKQKSGLEVILVSNFEKEFSKELDIDSILMSIKLSNNKERLIKFLKNDYLTDSQFISFLRLYDFGKDDIYSDDENRDVCVKIVERFCQLAKTNHNIQYAPIGIYYSALEASDSRLLEIIYNMPNYQISDKNAKVDQPLTLKEVVALNPNISEDLQKKIFKNRRINELKFLASNESLTESLQKQLISLDDEKILFSLIKSGNFSNKSLDTLLDDLKYRKEILKSFELDLQTFEKFFDILNDVELVYLSSNQYLTEYMIEKLYSKNIHNVNINLAKNSKTPEKIINEIFSLDDKIYNIAIAHNESLKKDYYYNLYRKEDYDVRIALAYNKSLPNEVYIKLSTLNDRNINEALCGNESTPISILMQFQFDGGLKTILSNNESYREFTRNKIGM